MIRSKKLSIAICAVATGILWNTAVLGQNNFSGSWILQNKESIAGPDYDNSLPKKITLNQQQDSLIIESIHAAAAGKSLGIRQSVATNGQPLISTTYESQKRYEKRLRWLNDQKVIELTTVFYRQDNPNEVDITRIETWVLSPDGKKLTIHKKSTETKDESWEVKGVYERNR